MVLDVIGPLLVFVEFLTHEQHGNAGRRHDQRRRHARPAPRVPGARVAAAHGEHGYPASAPAIDLVMALDVLDGTPGIGKPGRTQVIDDRLPVDQGMLAACRLFEDAPDRPPESVVPTGVESGAPFVPRPDDCRLWTPVLRDVDR